MDDEPPPREGPRGSSRRAPTDNQVEHGKHRSRTYRGLDHREDRRDKASRYFRVLDIESDPECSHLPTEERSKLAGISRTMYEHTMASPQVMLRRPSVMLNFLKLWDDRHMVRLAKGCQEDPRLIPFWYAIRKGMGILDKAESARSEFDTIKQWLGGNDDALKDLADQEPQRTTRREAPALVDRDPDTGDESLRLLPSWCPSTGWEPGEDASTGD